MKVQNTGDINLSISSFLIYGKSGKGKTTFAASFPKPLFLDFDDGMASVKDKKVDYIPMRNAQEFSQFLTGMSAFGGYETLVIDSLTMLTEIEMEKQLLLNKRKRPTLNEWGNLVYDCKEMLMRLLREYKKYFKYIIFVCHEEQIQDELTQEVIIRPLLPGKMLPEFIPQRVDEVYRLVTFGGKFYFFCCAEGNFITKSRMRHTQSKIEWKDGYKEVMAELKGGQDAQN